jgi:hypothetical protein
VIVVLLLCEDVRHMDGHRRVFLAVSQYVLSSCRPVRARTYVHMIMKGCKHMIVVEMSR